MRTLSRLWWNECSLALKAGWQFNMKLVTEYLKACFLTKNVEKQAFCLPQWA